MQFEGKDIPRDIIRSLIRSLVFFGNPRAAQRPDIEPPAGWQERYTSTQPWETVEGSRQLESHTPMGEEDIIHHK